MHLFKNIYNLVLSRCENLILERVREHIGVTETGHVSDRESKIIRLDCHISHGNVPSWAPGGIQCELRGVCSTCSLAFTGCCRSPRSTRTRRRGSSWRVCSSVRRSSRSRCGPTRVRSDPSRLPLLVEEMHGVLLGTARGDLQRSDACSVINGRVLISPRRPPVFPDELQERDVNLHVVLDPAPDGRVVRLQAALAELFIVGFLRTEKPADPTGEGIRGGTDTRPSIFLSVSPHRLLPVHNAHPTNARMPPRAGRVNGCAVLRCAAALRVTHPARCGRMTVKGRRVPPARLTPDRPGTRPPARERSPVGAARCEAKPARWREARREARSRRG